MLNDRLPGVLIGCGVAILFFGMHMRALAAVWVAAALTTLGLLVAGYRQFRGSRRQLQNDVTQ